MSGNFALKIDDQALFDAVDFLDEQSDFYLSSIGERVTIISPTAENIAKAIKENTVDFTLNGLQPQTQDAVAHLMNNQVTLNTISDYVEKGNIFEPEVEKTVLGLAQQYGATLGRVSQISLPPEDLKEKSLMLQLDNQQAKIKEMLSFLNFRNPELKKQVEINMDLDKMAEVRNRILNVDVSQQMKMSASDRIRIG